MTTIDPPCPVFPLGWELYRGRLSPLPVKMVYQSAPGGRSWEKADGEQEQALAARDREIKRLRAALERLADAVYAHDLDRARKILVAALPNCRL